MRTNRAAIILVGFSALFTAASAFPDTLIVVGVAVDKSGQRMPGALVRLCATTNRVGRSLAEDRTSERGIFTLFQTNIAGDIGDLYIVYEGDADKTAAPLKVTFPRVETGVKQARTLDLVILSTPANAMLSPEDATERIAAITQTQAVLVDAGIMDRSKGDEVIKAQTTRVMAQVETKGNFASGERVLKQFQSISIGEQIKTIDPEVIDWSRVAAAAAIKENLPTKHENLPTRNAK